MSKEIEDKIRFLKMCEDALESVTFPRDLLKREYPMCNLGLTRIDPLPPAVTRRLERVKLNYIATGPYRWICEACAMAMGGSDKRTLGATGHRGTCDKCDTEQDLFTVWDWSLRSDGKPRIPKRHEVD